MITDLIIKRSEWYRGKTYYGSKLVRAEDGLKCCLGFLGEACGVPLTSMIDIGTPEMMEEKSKKLFPSDYFSKTHLAYRSDLGHSILQTNDDQHMSEEQRESTLIELFKQLDINLRFEDWSNHPSRV